jgi:hypothetical protein
VNRDAMQYAELKPLEPSGVALSGSLTGQVLRVAAPTELLPLNPGTTEAQEQVTRYVREMPGHLSQCLLIELLSQDLASS